MRRTQKWLHVAGGRAGTCVSRDVDELTQCGSGGRSSSNSSSGAEDRERDASAMMSGAAWLVLPKYRTVNHRPVCC